MWEERRWIQIVHQLGNCSLNRASGPKNPMEIKLKLHVYVRNSPSQHLEISTLPQQTYRPFNNLHQVKGFASYTFFWTILTTSITYQAIKQWQIERSSLLLNKNKQYFSLHIFPGWVHFQATCGWQQGSGASLFPISGTNMGRILPELGPETEPQDPCLRPHGDM